MGALDLLPGGTARVLKDAAEATADNPGLLVNVAIGYGGRREIADAVRSLLHEHATRGTSDRGTRRDPGRRAHRRAPLHGRPARPGPGHPHLRRTAHRRIPAVADHPLGVLLLRRLLAGLPQGRLPPRPALLRRPQPPLRRLTNPRARAARPHGAARPYGSVGANAASARLRISESAGIGQFRDAGRNHRCCGWREPEPGELARSEQLYCSMLDSAGYYACRPTQGGRRGPRARCSCAGWPSIAGGLLPAAA